MVKIGVLRGFLTGSERVHGAKGRYIVTFGQEAVRGPQKRSKMSIFSINNRKFYITPNKKFGVIYL